MGATPAELANASVLGNLDARPVRSMRRTESTGPTRSTSNSVVPYSSSASVIRTAVPAEGAVEATGVAHDVVCQALAGALDWRGRASRSHQTGRSPSSFSLPHVTEEPPRISVPGTRALAATPRLTRRHHQSDGWEGARPHPSRRQHARHPSAGPRGRGARCWLVRTAPDGHPLRAGIRYAVHATRSERPRYHLETRPSLTRIRDDCTRLANERPTQCSARLRDRIGIGSGPLAGPPRGSGCRQPIDMYRPVREQPDHERDKLPGGLPV